MLVGRYFLNFRRRIKFFGIFSKFFVFSPRFPTAFPCPIFRSSLIKILTLWAKCFLNCKLQIPEPKMHIEEYSLEKWQQAASDSFLWQSSSHSQPLTLGKSLEKMTCVSWHNQVPGKTWQMFQDKSVLMHIVLPPEASSGLPQKVTEPYIIQKCRYNCKE